MASGTFIVSRECGRLVNSDHHLCSRGRATERNGTDPQHWQPPERPSRPDGAKELSLRV